MAAAKSLTLDVAPGDYAVARKCAISVAPAIPAAVSFHVDYQTGPVTAGVAGVGTFFLSANSILDFGDLGLGSNVIDFRGVGTHTLGALLQVTDYDFGSDHLYFMGSANDFINQYAQADVCFDGWCGYRAVTYDGYFEILQAPEPMSLSLVMLGLVGIGFGVRRKQAPKSPPAA